MKLCTDVILASQPTSVPTWQIALLGLAELKSTTLDSEVDPEGPIPARLLARNGVAGSCVGEREEDVVIRPSDASTLTGVLSRTCLRGTMDWHWCY